MTGSSNSRCRGGTNISVAFINAAPYAERPLFGRIAIAYSDLNTSARPIGNGRAAKDYNTITAYLAFGPRAPIVTLPQPELNFGRAAHAIWLACANLSNMFVYETSTLLTSLGPVADFEPGFGLALTYDTAGNLYVGTSNGISFYPAPYPLPVGGPRGYSLPCTPSGLAADITRNPSLHLELQQQYDRRL